MNWIIAPLLVLLWMVAPSWAADVVLNWNPNDESDLAGYKIYQSTVSGSYGAPVATLGKVITTTLTLPQLTVDTAYFFAIAAYDLAGNESGKSAEVTKLVAGVPVSVPPGVPVLSTSLVTTTGFDVSWAPVSDGVGGIANVDVRLGSSTDHWGIMVSQPCPSSPCRIVGLTSGTAYQVQAVAYRVEGAANVFGPLSSPIGVTTATPDIPPAIPTGLVIVSATAEKVVLMASATDCRRVHTSTSGSNSKQSVRTVTCVR